MHPNTLYLEKTAKAHSFTAVSTPMGIPLVYGSGKLYVILYKNNGMNIMRIGVIGPSEKEIIPFSIYTEAYLRS